MTFTAITFFLLGFAASWVAGRYVTKGATIVQGGAIGICGVAALMIGMPGILAQQFAWAMVALIIYGLIGALIFRSGQGIRDRSAREDAE
jgi:membrane-bound ClpP family serine protease